MPATFDKILGKPLLHSHKATDITDLSATVSDSVLQVIGNQTLTASSPNVILANATSGPITIILPAVATVTDKVFKIKKTDSSKNAVTVDGNGAETIDGSTVMVISFAQTTMEIESDGSAWYII